MHKGSIITVIIGIFFCLTSCSTREKHRILVIHSYEDTYAAYPDFDHEIISEFHKQGIDADVRFFYLDCESYNEKDELNRMYRMLDSVSAWDPEVIIVNEDQATYSLLKCGNPLAAELPVVFGGVNYPNWELIKLYPNVTGFHDKIDFKANIDFGKKILGESIIYFSVIDSTYLDRLLMADLGKQLKDAKVVGITTPGMPAKERYRLAREEGYTIFTRFRVRSYREFEPAGIMWAFNKFSSKQCYLQLKRDFTTINVGNICSSPSMTAINEGFGYGEKLLGGYMTTMPIQIEETVGAASRILSGVSPSDIPITESRKEYVMDWVAMQQKKISKDSVPAGCKIIHIPFHKLHPVLWVILLICISVILLSAFSYMFFLYLRESKRRRKVLYDLADEKETLALAIEGGDTFAWRMENGVIIFEKAFWEAQGLKKRELTEEDLAAYVHPNSLRIFEHERTLLPHARHKIVELLCDFNGKGYQWWEFRYTTIPSDSGGIKTAGLLLNVQHIKDRERELEDARRLAEKAELKQSFLANMSHEIRTPLNAIVGFSNILTSGEELDEEDKQEYVETINRNSELLLKLINDILELSRIDSGYMSFEYRRYRVEDIVNDTYLTHQMLLSGKLQFLKEEDSTPMEVDVDRNRLTQVLTNFINNASKFTSEGYIKLGYRYLPDEGAVRIFVEDTGRGIPQEEQKMIFSRFYKQDEFAQGAGLGLSICQVIIEKLGGRIELQSELGKGSCFSVVLPCYVIS